MKKKLILFDFDGTVVDNSEGIYNCIKYSLEKMNKPIPAQNILRKFIGPSLFDSFMEHIEKNSENADVFISGYRERYKPIGSTEVRVYDGMRELLNNLKKEGFLTAVCSSKPYEFVRKIAYEQQLEALFDGFFCPNLQCHLSDKSALALEAIKYFGVTKDETVLVGDTKYDIAAASDAGISCVGVLYGFSDAGEMDTADATASDVKDIYAIITGDVL